MGNNPNYNNPAMLKLAALTIDEKDQKIIQLKNELSKCKTMLFDVVRTSDETIEDQGYNNKEVVRRWEAYKASCREALKYLGMEAGESK